MQHPATPRHAFRPSLCLAAPTPLVLQVVKGRVTAVEALRDKLMASAAEAFPEDAAAYRCVALQMAACPPALALLAAWGWRAGHDRGAGCCWPAACLPCSRACWGCQVLRMTCDLSFPFSGTHVGHHRQQPSRKVASSAPLPPAAATPAGSSPSPASCHVPKAGCLDRMRSL